ncbi:Uncharacterised protein [BD1-7 clade bacterium]|uniref:Uncharacterized protein n=1 Tax=BD1-7 clade bacterium TaxID=2029982 RepID=A0A5S9QWN6_9GAMM|nr:Uncharacterised protein [BD1-7 clade bacterium]
MKFKKLLLASSISAAVLMTGCGSSDNNDNDKGGSTGGGDNEVCAEVGKLTGANLTVNGASVPVCELKGAITQDAELTTDYVYELDGYVTVGAGNEELASAAEVQSVKDNGVTLTVNEGVHFRSSGQGTLIVTRGSKIMANGTADAPIVMSSKDDGYDGRGEWGGLVIQGFAKNNVCGVGSTNPVCNAADEAETGRHGGNDNADNSGEVEYLIITEGGNVVRNDEEINGLTLHSVGAGTKLENIMVNNNVDDGIEFFGGAANVKNLILTNNGDESIDWDDGFQGNVQFALVRQAISDSADKGIEADSEGNTNAPFAYPTIANVTFELVDSSEDHSKLFSFKKGTGAKLINVAALGYDKCFNFEDDATGMNTGAPLVFAGVKFDCDGTLVSASKGATQTDANVGQDLDGTPVTAASLVDTSIALDSAYALVSGGSSSVSPEGTEAVSEQVDEFLMATDYIGAVEPGTAEANAWWKWAEAVIPAAFGSTPIDPALCVAGTDTGTTLEVNGVAKPVCELSGAITADTTLSSDYVFELDGYVTVGTGNEELSSAAEVQSVKNNGVTLTVDAGTHFRSSGQGTLIVTRGSKIMANGTAADPIVMSSKDDGYDGRGEWGGLVIQGFAKNNVCGVGSINPVCNAADEAETGRHGGNDNADNSGEVEFLIITEGGNIVRNDEEINGLTLHSVGYGTKLENIMVNNNVDDGIEFFGGAANVKNLILTNNGDESIDWDDGFQGNVQFALVRQAISDSADKGIEADSEGNANAPYAYPTIANVTFELVDSNEDHSKLFSFKKGSGAKLINVAALNYDSCFKFENDATGNNMGAPLVFDGVKFDCSGTLVDSSKGATQTALNVGQNLAGNTVSAASLVDTTISLDDAFALSAAAGASSVSPEGTETVDDAANDFLMATDYIGAVEPGTAKATAWWKWAEDVIPAAFESAQP